MKKLGLICLACVMALGALGVGYAAWTDEVVITGTVGTGELKLGFTEVFSEIPALPCNGDFEYTDFVPVAGSVSCPPGYNFTNIHTIEECKDVGSVEMERFDDDGDGCYERMEITINNAYPYYLAWISCHLINCGSIPVKIYPVISMVQDDGVLIKWGNSYGAQLEPGEDAELSFYVGFPQHLMNPDTGLFDGELLPQNSQLTFTITLGGIQWNEYAPLP